MINRLDFDDLLADSDFHIDPHAVFHQMRENAPVYWSDVWNAWVLTRYDDVMTVLRDHQRFSSAGRISYLLRGLDQDTREKLSYLERHYTIGLAHSDPPDHTRLRGLLQRVFTPRMVARWRPRIEQVAHELIRDMRARTDPDILRDLAYPLPATVIAEMIGAPPEEIHHFRDWAVAINRLFELGGRIDAKSALTAQQSLHEMREYIGKLMADRHTTPQDDIIGRLVASDDQLSVDELVSTCVTLFVAGHETTTNLISNTLYLLLTHPAQRDALVADPLLIDQTIEEALRFEPSVPRAWRIAREDVLISGQVIRTGDLVFPMLSAANRDPAHFAEPDIFNIQRESGSQLAFGYGIHYCIGAPLARVEGAIALEALLPILLEIQIKDSPRWRSDVAIRGLESLRILL